MQTSNHSVSQTEGNSKTTRQYMSYEAMSKYLLVCGIIVLIYCITNASVTSPIVLFSFDVNVMYVVAAQIAVSIIYGVMYYLSTVSTPYEEQRNILFRRLFPSNAVIFNRQFQFLVMPHLFFIFLLF